MPSVSADKSLGTPLIEPIVTSRFAGGGLEPPARFDDHLQRAATSGWSTAGATPSEPVPNQRPESQEPSTDAARSANERREQSAASKEVSADRSPNDDPAADSTAEQSPLAEPAPGVADEQPSNDDDQHDSKPELMADGAVAPGLAVNVGPAPALLNAPRQVPAKGKLQIAEETAEDIGIVAARRGKGAAGLPKGVGRRAPSQADVRASRAPATAEVAPTTLESTAAAVPAAEATSETVATTATRGTAATEQLATSETVASDVGQSATVVPARAPAKGPSPGKANMPSGPDSADLAAGARLPQDTELAAADTAVDPSSQSTEAKPAARKPRNSRPNPSGEGRATRASTTQSASTDPVRAAAGNDRVDPSQAIDARNSPAARSAASAAPSSLLDAVAARPAFSAPATHAVPAAAASASPAAVSADSVSQSTARPEGRAASATAGDSAAVHVDRTRFVQRVARAFRAAGERGPLRMRLSPPELGTLRLEVTVRGGAMTARLEAETQAARSMLLENLPALRERLSEQGIRVERFDVDLHGGTSSELSQRQADQSNRQPAAAGAQPVGNRVQVAGADEPAVPRWTADSGRLNVVI